MIRVIAIGLAVWLALWLLSGLLQRLRRDDKPAKPSDSVPEVVRCAHCGVHIPENEAVSDARGRRYCSEQHRRADQD